MKYQIIFLCLFFYVMNVQGQEDQKNLIISIQASNKSNAENLYQEDNESKKKSSPQKLQPDTSLTQFMIINFVKYKAVTAVIASPAGLPYLVNRFMIYPFFSSSPWIDTADEKEEIILKSKDQKKVPEIIVFPIVHYLRKKMF